MSFYQRSLALFFGELAGPPVTVADARETVAGEQVKGLRITVRELGYVSMWYVKSRAWHVARAGAAPQRTPVPGSAVIYQVGTEVVGDLLRIAQQAYLQPGGDKAQIESYVRTYEGFLQHNIPQGLASLKAYDGVERARALLEELRREYQAGLAAAAAPAPTGQIPVPVAAPPIEFAVEPPVEIPILVPQLDDPSIDAVVGVLPVEADAFPIEEPGRFVYDLDVVADDEEIELTYDAEAIAWPPAVPAFDSAPLSEPPPVPVAEPIATFADEPMPVPVAATLPPAAAEPVAPWVESVAPAAAAPVTAPADVAPAPTPAPAAEPVTVVPQTTASYVFDQALVGLLGRLGSSYPWLLPDYGRHGEGMGVRVTLPAGLSVVFTHVETAWTAYALPETGPAVEARLEDDDAVFRWALPRIREFTTAYAAQLGAVRPGDAAQLFQRVADLS